MVVDPPQQHALVADHDASLVKLLRSLFGDPRYLVGVVKVRMQGHRLAALLGLVRHVDQCRAPCIRRVEYAAGCHGQPFGSKSEAADMWDVEEAVTNHLDVFRLEIVRVAPRDDNVLELMGVFDVGKDLIPATTGRLERGLGDLVGVGADAISSRAVATVRRTD